MSTLIPADAEATHGGFRRQLGLFDATMIVAGSMIGSGIFIVSADIARDVGSSGWLLLTWAIAGVMTVIGALAYAELAAMMPAAGGQYVYLREAYGPLWAFVFGWTSFLIIQTGFIAAVSVAFAKYLGVLVPSLGTNNILAEWSGFNIEISTTVPWMDDPLVFFKRDKFTISAGQCVAVGVAVFLTMLNCLGVREGKWVQNIFTVTKTVGLLALIGVGLTLAVDPAAVEENTRNVWGGITTTQRFADTIKIVPVTEIAVVLVLCGAMVGSLFSADAWANVTFAAAEVHEPRRNVPRCLILGTGLVVVLYFLANVAYLASLSIQGIARAPDDRVATAVLERVSPGAGVSLMAGAIMVSAFGCVNGIVLAASRLYYAMARDGLFFRSVGELSSRGVPFAGLLLQLAWSVVLIFSGSYSELLDYVIFAALLFYVLTIVALFVLRRKRPEWPRPYQALGYPVLPALYVALCSVIMLGLLVVKPIYSWPSFVIILSGIPVYYLWRAIRGTPPDRRGGQTVPSPLS